MCISIIRSTTYIKQMVDLISKMNDRVQCG
jgi:hypothetical protein